MIEFYFVVAIALGPWWILVPQCLWAQWLAERPAAPRFVALTSYTLFVVAGILGLCAVAAAANAERFRQHELATGTPDAFQAFHEAEVISVAMNGGALVFGVAVSLQLWLLVVTWRWHWSRKSRDEEAHHEEP